MWSSFMNTTTISNEIQSEPGHNPAFSKRDYSHGNEHDLDMFEEK